LPYAEHGDFYTFYFSRGLILEADLIATQLRAEPAEEVVQVYCDPSLATVVTALRESLRTLGTVVEDLYFDCADSVPVAALAARMADGNTAAVLWITAEQFAGLVQPLPAGRTYVSSTLLSAKPARLLQSAPGPVLMVHPYRLPGSVDPAMRRFQAWARTRRIELSHPKSQAEAFFGCMLLNHTLKDMGRFFVRDYLLDMLDHSQSMVAYLPIYPRPTLGPGQRFLNKGGYVLPILDGQIRTEGAAWILP
jgi:hypothetical protein